MSTRYMTNAVIALVSGFLVVISRALYSSTAVSWVAFGVAIGVVAISAVAQLDRRRGLAQRLVDAAVGMTAGTLIAVSIVFGGATVAWLVFALALGLVGAAFAGMTLHEVANWRELHDLGRLRWLEPETVTEAKEVAAPPRAA